MWGSGDIQQEYGKREVFKKSFFSRKPCGAGTSLVGAEKALVLF